MSTSIIKSQLKTIIGRNATIYHSTNDIHILKEKYYCTIDDVLFKFKNNSFVSDWDGDDDFEYYPLIHNDNGPAIIIENAVSVFIKNNLRHCDYGPAIIYENGLLLWYLNNINFSFDNWCKETDKSDEEINFIKLKWNII